MHRNKVLVESFLGCRSIPRLIRVRPRCILPRGAQEKHNPLLRRNGGRRAEGAVRISRENARFKRRFDVRRVPRLLVHVLEKRYGRQVGREPLCPHAEPGIRFHDNLESLHPGNGAVRTACPVAVALHDTLPGERRVRIGVAGPHYIAKTRRLRQRSPRPNEQKGSDNGKRNCIPHKCGILHIVSTMSICTP